MVRLFDTIFSFALRRLRLLTVLLIVGVFSLILAESASWTSAIVALAIVVILAFGWAAAWVWLYVFGRSGRSNRT